MAIKAGIVLAVTLHGCWCRRWVTHSCCNPSECMHGVHAGLHCSQWLPECHWLKCFCVATLDKHNAGQWTTVQTDHWWAASWVVWAGAVNAGMQLLGRLQVSTAVIAQGLWTAGR